MPRFKTRYVFEEEVAYGDQEEAEAEAKITAAEIAGNELLTVVEVKVEEV